MEISDYELLLDSLQMAGVYVIRKDNHQILYFNQWMKKTVPDLVLGAVRHELWVDMLPEGRTEMKNENINDAHPWKGTVRIEAADVLWEKKIPASVVTVIPCKESTAGKKEREYIGKSLGNLFFAIYDIDLEEDVFHTVNQREEVKNILGTEMSFTEAIRIYSEHFVHSDCREEYVQKMSRTNLLEKLSESRPFVAMEYHRIKIDAEGVPEGDGWVRATVIATEFRDGKSSKALYVAQDISEVKKKEEMEHQMLKEACEAANRANASKSEFLSRMSHDIRTPMNAIVGMTAIAVANIDNPQQVNNCLKKITLSSRHLLGLINDVLDMSKIESGKMTLNEELVSLREVMDSIVSIVQPQVKSKRQHFNIFIHDISAEDVCCDGVRLNQVILNLISNAVKFTPEEGDIRVSMYEEPSPKGSSYIRIHFHVKDNGIGMSEEFQSEIFESFTREDRKRVHKTEGTGLGMAITKYIVDAMGGSIEVKSRQGEGTEFHIILDFKIATEKEKDMHLPNCDMLVVDDNKQLCESVVQSLESIGISAEWAMDGESAIRRVHERHQRNEDYQFILLDWKLPGMDGIDTAKEMRKQLGDNVPILLISAYDWGEIEQDARNAGITGFISKPLFKSTLYYGLKPYTENIQSETEEEGENRVNPHLEGKRILLAEDNELNWEVASELLQELGLILDWAENGKICVDKFKESAPGFYSAVLMDIRMPVMNGYEATMAIRSMEREDSHIPIIAMTADAFSEDVKRCLDCGMNAHAAKPIDIKEIARLLEKYFTGQL